MPTRAASLSAKGNAAREATISRDHRFRVSVTTRSLREERVKETLLRVIVEGSQSSSTDPVIFLLAPSSPEGMEFTAKVVVDPSTYSFGLLRSQPLPVVGP
jgi:hypothetical protein